MRAQGSIRANRPKLKNHRLSQWILIRFEKTVTAQRTQQTGVTKCRHRRMNAGNLCPAARYNASFCRRYRSFSLDSEQ